MATAGALLLRQDGFLGAGLVVKARQCLQLGIGQPTQAVCEERRLRSDVGDERQDGFARLHGQLLQEGGRGGGGGGGRGCAGGLGVLVIGRLCGLDRVQLRLQHGEPAAGLARIPNIVQGVVQGRKLGFLVRLEVVDEDSVAQLARSRQTGRDAVRYQRLLQEQFGLCVSLFVVGLLLDEVG